MNCTACGQERPEDELIQFEGRWICAACKPEFFQRMLEGQTPLETSNVPVGFDEQIVAPMQLIALTWKFLCMDWPAIMAVTLLGAVPMSAVFTLIDQFATYWVQHSFLRVGVNYTVQGVIAVLGTLGTARIVSERLEGRGVSAGEAVRHAFRRWLPAIGTNLLQGAIICILLALLVVPGMIWMVYYTFSSVVVSLRACSGVDALNYSRSLVLGRWWAVFGRGLLLGLVLMVVVVPVQIGVRLLHQWPFMVYAGLLVVSLSGTFVKVGNVLLFLNLDAVRRRSQGGSPSPGGVPV